MPSGLLGRWSGSRAGCGLPGSEPTPQPRAGIAARLAAEAARRGCVRSAPAPRGHCASPSGSGRSFAAPPALCRAEGAGAGRRAEGAARAGERPRARAAGGEGGKEEARGGLGWGARPRPGPSEPPTSPCNFGA